MQTSNTALRKNDFEFATLLHLLPGEFAVNGPRGIEAFSLTDSDICHTK